MSIPQHKIEPIPKYSPRYSHISTLQKFKVSLKVQNLLTVGSYEIKKKQVILLNTLIPKKKTRGIKQLYQNKTKSNSVNLNPIARHLTSETLNDLFGS